MPLDLLRQPEPATTPKADAKSTIALPQAPSPDRRSLIDAFIDEQQSLTAVERFARRHEHGEVPAHAKYYRDLIPLSLPKAGQQYAFDVDMDACTGCKACVTACHNLNGLDADEVFRDVGLLVGGSADQPILQHVTTACHHCLEPACLEGCPVMAYDKDPVTGIVKHLDDQCIGCQYCIFKCPYDVPKYNSRLGIVRKCDMCSDRLSAGEAPACVQACPNQAIRITIVDRAKVIEDNEANLFLPGTPEPDYTQPTTNYRTQRVMPRNMLPADHHYAAPQHAHMPLVAMLVLTQLSVGAFLVERVVRDLLAAASGVTLVGQGFHSIVALAVGLLALGASTMHLGRPFYAFRAIIGLRTSWLSREIVGFGLFAGAASLYAGGSFFLPDLLGPSLLKMVSTTVIIVGLLSVFCSAMIYHDTRRDFWSFGQSGAKFILTTIVLGIATTLLTMAVYAQWTGNRSTLHAAAPSLCFALAIFGGIKLIVDVSVLRHLTSHQLTLQRKTARLLFGPLVNFSVARILLGLLGSLAVPLILALGPSESIALVAVGIVFAFSLIGEFLERYLFFAAVVPPKMPGGAAL